MVFKLRKITTIHCHKSRTRQGRIFSQLISKLSENRYPELTARHQQPEMNIPRSPLRSGEASQLLFSTKSSFIVFAFIFMCTAWERHVSNAEICQKRNHQFCLITLVSKSERRDISSDINTDDLDRTSQICILMSFYFESFRYKKFNVIK